MTYTSGNPVSVAPEAKLADRRWRYLNSWWIFPPILSLGLLGWLGFMVAGARTHQKKYWLFSGLYAAVLVVALTLNIVGGGADNPDGLLVNLSVVFILAAWIAPTIHAAVLNKQYLRTLAAQGAWYNTPQAQPAQRPGAAAQPFMGVSDADYYGPGTQPRPQSVPQPPAYPGTPAAHPPQPAANGESSTPAPQGPSRPASSAVNVEQATIEQLTAVPGVDHALANRIIAIRDARGGYRDLDDLASAANLQPHELVRLRDHLTFATQTPPQQSQRGQQGTGRILDI